MPTANRVLVLSASVGAGHVRAAQAVEKAFQQSQSVAEIRHIDTLDFTNQLFRKLYGQLYLDLVNKMPEVLGWIYDSLDKPWRYERRRLLLDRLNTRPFVKMLKEYQPDIVVCTHFLPSEIISWLKAKGRLSMPQSIVVTDFDVHAMWLCHHYEQYFVALDETRVHMTELGIPADKITVTGIPIDPVFALRKVKSEMRLKHGLHPDLPTLLISAGGFGVGPIEHLMISLLKLKHPAQVVALCGRSAELKARVERVVATADKSAVQVHVQGFTTEMDEYMTAADLIVGKPGGLTTSESLAKGLVFVIVNPIPGQEERNADHLLEAGAAIRCNNLPTLAYKIDALLDDPRRFRAMQAASRRLAKPHAARDIVNKMLTLT